MMPSGSMTAEDRLGRGESGRLARLRRDQGRRRRRRALVALAALALVALLVVGSLLEIPYLDIVRSLAGRLLGEPGKVTSQARYDFLRYPRAGGEIEGDVDVLFALRHGDEVLAILLFTCNPQESRKEFLLLPEGIHAYDAEGAELPLRRTLSGKEGRDLLRAAAGSMSGATVEYLVVYDLEGCLAIMDSLVLPPVRLGEDLEVVDPRDGRRRISAGQAVRDSDRVLSYLLAGDAADPLAAREERLRSFLGGLLSSLESVGREALEELFATHPPALFYPDPAGGELPAYLASMVEAACDPSAGEPAVRATPPVEVLNGCGVPQLGAKVAEALARRGIRVSGSAGNAKVTVDGMEFNDFTHEKSLIRYGREERHFSAYAQYLGVLLNVTEVVYDPGVGSRVVLVAGRDAAAGKFGT